MTEENTIENIEENIEENTEEKKTNTTDKLGFVYLLETMDKKHTYIGASVNVFHRLRQHNNEIAGGAVATTRQSKKGNLWHRVCYIQTPNFYSSALQFEWRWKQLSRKLPSTMKPLERRMVALTQLLALERSTTKAIPYSEWTYPPTIVYE